MINNIIRGIVPADDAKLRDILKRYDPVTPPTVASLSVLEACILAQVDCLTDPTAPNGVGIFAGIFQQGWMPRAAAFAAVLVVVSGFLVGQAFYSAEHANSLTGNLSLVAFADDTSGQSVPSTVVTLGENYDDAE